jgi:hypothetical protein
MEIGKAFGFVTEDEQWITKVLIGGLIQFVPLLGTIAILGYSYRVALNVARGNPRPLPAWGEFGDFLGRGFFALVIQIVYLLPLIVLYGVFAFLTGAACSGSRRVGCSRWGYRFARFVVPHSAPIGRSAGVRLCSAGGDYALPGD